MTKTLSGKPVFPKTVFIVQVAYQRYAFDTIDLAARFIDSVSSATPVSRDYNAPNREDRAEQFYKEQTASIASLEVVKAIIVDERTPENEPEVIVVHEGHFEA
jgi:hypothetical protein